MAPTKLYVLITAHQVDMGSLMILVVKQIAETQWKSPTLFKAVYIRPRDVYMVF